MADGDRTICGIFGDIRTRLSTRPTNYSAASITCDTCQRSAVMSKLSKFF